MTIYGGIKSLYTYQVLSYHMIIQSPSKDELVINFTGYNKGSIQKFYNNSFIYRQTGYTPVM